MILAARHFSSSLRRRREAQPALSVPTPGAGSSGPLCGVELWSHIRIQQAAIRWPHFWRTFIMATASGHTSAIRAKKVIGTTVKDTSGSKIGQIEDVVLDKLSNNIMFAVVGFGGFLGMSEKFHPIPWAALDYDESEDAYVVSFSKEQLQGAPSGSIDELTRNDSISVRNRTFDYYKAPRYWEGNAIR
jgi:sporulation protein YlmC with PRC-barrel domain